MGPRDIDHTIFDQYREADINTVCSNGLKESTISSSSSSSLLNKNKKKSVTFGSVSVREYAIVLGDNPSVSRGAPISLGWDYFSTSMIDLDEYEIERLTKRSMLFRHQGYHNNMMMNHLQRRTILRVLGYSDEEINDAAIEAKRTQARRKSSLRFMWTKERCLFLYEKTRNLPRLLRK